MPITNRRRTQSRVAKKRKTIFGTIEIVRWGAIGPDTVSAIVQWAYRIEQRADGGLCACCDTVLGPKFSDPGAFGIMSFVNDPRFIVTGICFICAERDDTTLLQIVTQGMRAIVPEFRVIDPIHFHGPGGRA